jgi:DNA repair protein RecO (recombination protein O)
MDRSGRVGQPRGGSRDHASSFGLKADRSPSKEAPDVPAVRSMALVIRSVDVFETSKVLTLFTRDLGKVSALAKGARRLKSPFQAALDLLSVCDIVVLHKASDALDLLTEATLVERFDPLRRDLAALYAGFYVAELLNELTDHHDPHPKLFDAAAVTLRHLGDPALRPRRVLRFELACLRELGLMPELGACVHCGRDVDASGHSVAFGLATGGVLCPACRPGQPHVATLSGRTLDAIRVLAAPGRAWRDMDVDASGLAPVRGTIGAVISHLIGRRPRLLPYL